LGPFIGFDVVSIDEIIGQHGVYLTPEEVNKLIVDDGSVRLEFYGLSVQFIIEPHPVILFAVLRNIDAMEVTEHALVRIETPVDIKLVFVDGGCMIRSGRYIFALDFDLSPAGIK